MPASVPSLPAPRWPDAVQAIRRFNRFYTRQIGVLEEHLLQSPFSLTEVRVLYELAHRPRLTAAELGEDLGLDRGYLSRILENFENQAWIMVTPSPQDRRKQFLSLTAKGRKSFAPVERRASDQVAAMLSKISPAHQQSLLAAMEEIENVLAPGTADTPTYALRQHRPGDMGWVVQRHGELYWQEYHYDERFEGLVAEIVARFIQNLDPQRERCWIAEKDGQKVGSVFLVNKSASVAKLRLLLVEPSARGLGIGRGLVEECVGFAQEAGYKRVMLWTQSELAAARRIYQAAGFQRVAEESHNSWGRKNLVAETWELRL
jgi:DNA-binding MarR family transcriptional regulator/N-acetylglutamate synthase-like GNAT family acetyltransferase